MIGTATHWCGEVMSELVSSFTKGDHDRAQELNASLFDSYAYESREIAQFALAVKVALRVLGLPVRTLSAARSAPSQRGSRTTRGACSTASGSLG